MCLLHSFTAFSYYKILTGINAPLKKGKHDPGSMVIVLRHQGVAILPGECSRSTAYPRASQGGGTWKGTTFWGANNLTTLILV